MAIEFISTKAEADRIRRKEPNRIIPSRFVLTKKSQELGERWKAKARWILLGHRDPDALMMERFSPTPAGPTVMLAFQILASMKYQLVIMDVTSAFGQSLRQGLKVNFTPRCLVAEFPDALSGH